jgi:arginine repressor
MTTSRSESFEALGTAVTRVLDLENGCVVQTLPGGAQRVAAAIDSYASGRSVNLITLAGDDAVMVFDYVDPANSPVNECTALVREIVAGYSAEPMTPREVIGRCVVEVVDVNTTIVGLRTLIGAAQLVAAAIDELGAELLAGFAGSVAGDDMVFVAIRAATARTSSTGSRIRLLIAGPDL